MERFSSLEGRWHSAASSKRDMLCFLFLVLFLMGVSVQVRAQKVRATTVGELVSRVQPRLPLRVGRSGSVNSVVLEQDTVTVVLTMGLKIPKVERRLAELHKYRHQVLMLLLMTQTDLSIPRQMVRDSIWLRMHVQNTKTETERDLLVSPADLGEALALTAKRTGLPKGVDSLYVEKPAQAWTFKLRANLSGSDVVMHTTTAEGEKVKSEMMAQHKVTLTASASLRGLGLSLALNPTKLFGKYSDYEINLNSYSNRYGFDIIYNRTASYTGHYTVDGGGRTDLPKGVFSQNMFTVDGYYCFNYRHFSYPAAFSQSQIQRRSCGSWLLGAAFVAGRFRENAAEDYHVESATMHLRQWYLGGGYGYNFVLPHQWLIHVSGVPQLVVFAYDDRHTEEGKQHLHTRFPSVVVNGRLAVVHNFKNQFLGASAVINNHNSGHDDLRLYNVKWRARLFYGIRL